jgi:hypothetical protein
MCARADVGEGAASRIRVASERNRPPDLAHRPQSECEEEHRRDAYVYSEAKGQIVVAAGLKLGQRMFKMVPRFGVLSANQWVVPAMR